MRKITALIAGAAIIAAIVLSFSSCAKTYPAKTEEQIVETRERAIAALKSKGYENGEVSEKDLYREMIFKLMH